MCKGGGDVFVGLCKLKDVLVIKTNPHPTCYKLTTVVSSNTCFNVKME